MDATSAGVPCIERLRRPHETGPQKIDRFFAEEFAHRTGGGPVPVEIPRRGRHRVGHTAVGAGWSPVDVYDESRARRGAPVAASVSRSAGGGVARRHHRAGRAADHRRSGRRRVHRTPKDRPPEPLPNSRGPATPTSECIASHDRRVAGSAQRAEKGVAVAPGPPLRAQRVLFTDGEAQFDRAPCLGMRRRCSPARLSCILRTPFAARQEPGGNGFPAWRCSNT